MMRRLRNRLLGLLVVATGLVSASAGASEGPAAADALLARAVSTLAGSDWSGVYVHTAGGQSESFRTSRRVESVSDTERVEALEGQAREIVRQGDEIHLFLPGRREVRIERRIATSGFPQVLPADPTVLGRSYRVSVSGTGRVASRDAVIVRLQAIDSLRYSREIWLDRETALPLKQRVLDAAGAVLEQTAFSEVSVGRRIAASRVQPGRQVGYAGWDVKTLTAPLPEGVVPPDAARLGQGFRLLGGVARKAIGEAPAATHWAFGDGLAVVSVFAEDAAALPGVSVPVAAQRGALGVVETALNGRRLIAVGEVPRALLERSLAAVGAAPR
ncbi:MAG: MucB/RseB C-terminal domain-containing protein [Pseudomonadota bacterium]|jgi:sigma-E factor negative regulatory protein RseB